MGMSVGTSGGGGRRGRRSRRAPMAEINVTPFVDVMLVLLIIFMVAAPLMTVGVPIELPQSRAQALDTPQDPITIGVTPTGEVFLGEEQVALDGLIAQVSQRAVNGTEDRIFVRGDAAADYGTVMQVMGLLSGAGYSKIGLITEQEQGP